MDIAKMSTMLSQAQVKQQTSLSVMKMIMDTEKMQAGEMVEMMDGGSAWPDANHPHLGGKINIKS